jgi:hypothetical protein
MYLCSPFPQKKPLLSWQSQGGLHRYDTDVQLCSGAALEQWTMVHTLKRPYCSGIPFTLGLCNGLLADVLIPPPFEMEIYKICQIYKI